jgi:hypothetical protein
VRLAKISVRNAKSVAITFACNQCDDTPMEMVFANQCATQLIGVVSMLNQCATHQMGWSNAKSVCDTNSDCVMQNQCATHQMGWSLNTELGWFFVKSVRDTIK